jgi:hypothetical protein
LANFQRIIELITQKIVNKLSKIWVCDPRSEIRKKPIPDPGSRGQKGTGSQIRIRNTGFLPGKSCATNLTMFMGTVTKATDEGKAVNIIYLDFAKAFDKVPQ